MYLRQCIYVVYKFDQYVCVCVLYVCSVSMYVCVRVCDVCSVCLMCACVCLRKREKVLNVCHRVCQVHQCKCVNM